MARVRNVVEGMVIALDAMRANKLRSGLTILGVVIGVATVMTMASIVQGIRTQIFNAIEIAGPDDVLRGALLLADAAQSRPAALRGAHPAPGERARMPRP